ncbi:MAG: S9 family peptidase [Longimicrobiales bacterium]
MSNHAPRIRATFTAIAALAAVLAPASPLHARQAQADERRPAVSSDDPRLALLRTEDYLTPPQEVLDAVLATTVEDVRLDNLDPSGRFFLRTVGDGFPTLARFAKRHFDLGQFQIDPLANRDRRLTTRSDVGIEVYTRDGQLATTIDVPDGARVSGAEWSPDGSTIAFFAHFPDETHIYTANAESGDSRRLTRSPVLATHVTDLEWTGDGEHIMTVLMPENRGEAPVEPAVPQTPKVRITTPDRNRLRTYFDLLENPYEKQLVRYYSTGQLARIEVDSRDVERIGAPAMIEQVSASPDGAYFRVATMKDDLSYIVPVNDAGTVDEIWNTQGQSLAVIQDEDVDENVQNTGDDDDEDDDGAKRAVTWRTGGEPGLVFLQHEPQPDDEEGEEEDTGDDSRMDRVMYWLPPFDSSSTQLVYETEDEIDSFSFDSSGRILFLTRQQNETQTVHAVLLDNPEREYLISEDDTEDVLDDPGSLMVRDDAVRTSTDGRSVYLSGTQHFEDALANAPRPFVDRVVIATGEKERVFQSDADTFEEVNTVLNDDVTQFIVTRESRSMVPNQWFVNRTTGEERQLTFNEDHHPRITAARRELFNIVRPDGFTSRVSVTLPAGYQQGNPLPAMFWFYPREYTEQEAYDESLDDYNKNEFPNVGARSMAILTLLGYALIEPDLPIVGPEGQMNDEYPHDLRNTLATVIDSITARGWVDRNRLGIGGHSYGAFGTANAMIQTPFFKAGIAGDGNYNRSLTPAGFQREDRYLWEAQDLYVEMSPFFQADRLSGALLMYHGMDDHNVGTHPIHADRMFHALEVLGKTASMYKYPFEDHGPATRETTLDLWARWVAWLDTFVKNPRPAPQITTQDRAPGS